MNIIMLIVRLLLALNGFPHGVHLNDALLIQVTERLNNRGGGTLAMDVGINNYAFDAISFFRDPLQGFRQAGQAGGATVTPFGAPGYKGWTMTNSFSSYSGLSALASTPLYRGWSSATASRDATGYHLRLVYNGRGFAPLSTRLRLSDLMTLRYRLDAPGRLVGATAAGARQGMESYLVNLVNDRQVAAAEYSTGSRAVAPKRATVPLALPAALLAAGVAGLVAIILIVLIVARRTRRRPRAAVAASGQHGYAVAATGGAGVAATPAAQGSQTVRMTAPAQPMPAPASTLPMPPAMTQPMPPAMTGPMHPASASTQPMRQLSAVTRTMHPASAPTQPMGPASGGQTVRAAPVSGTAAPTARMGAPVRCLACQAELPAEARFCNSCGMVLAGRTHT